MEGDAVKGPVVCVDEKEALQALNKMKTGKAPVPSEVSLELIAACGVVRIQLMAEIYQSPRWIWSANRIGSENSGSNLMDQG